MSKRIERIGCLCDRRLDKELRGRRAGRLGRGRSSRRVAGATVILWEAMLWTKQLPASGARDRCIENLSAFTSSTHGLRPGLARFACHDTALCADMTFHADVGIFSGGYSDWGIAKRAAGSDAVVLGLVVLWTAVGFDKKVLLAEAH